MMRIPKWLRTWLREWAEWHESNHGYSASTPEWRAAHAQTGGEFSSREPRGVDPPHRIQKIHEAMQRLSADACLAQGVRAVRDFYVFGAQGAAMNKVSRSVFMQRRMTGELALLAYFRGRIND